MSALTTLFSSLANKIRSKTGGSDTYTPTEMVDAIDDVFDAGVESATTPITPSNSTPVSMLSGSGYKPTANGYAISSYDSVTPSSTPESVASGDIVKIGGSGVIVDAIPTPTSITPDNSSPVQMTTGNEYSVSRTGYAIQSYDSITPSSTPESVSSGDIVKIGGSGVIVDAVSPTPTSITPSNSSPVALTADTPVNPTASGYAIESYTRFEPSNLFPIELTANNPVIPSGSGVAIGSYLSITPSTDGTAFPSGFVKMSSVGWAIRSFQSVTPTTSGASFDSGFVKMSSSGYAYSARPTQVNIGAPDIISQANMGSNTSRSVSLTKMPKYVIFLLFRTGSDTGRGNGYFYDVDNNEYALVTYDSSGTYNGTKNNAGMPSSITSLTSSSVTFKNANAVTMRTHVLIYY